jgi:hypothetical protein
MQVIFGGSTRQEVDQCYLKRKRSNLKDNYRKLDITTIMEIFNKFGWKLAINFRFSAFSITYVCRA